MNGTAKRRPADQRRGSVFFEYILLLTLIGLGGIVGLASVRNALVLKLVAVAEEIEGQPADDAEADSEGISINDD